MLLAVMFGQLTKRVPNSDGGLYAYARHEFGDFAGYLTGWCYWISGLGRQRRHRFVLGLLRRRPVRHQPPVGHGELGHRAARPVGPAAVNLAGVRQMAWFQNVTVVLKFLPLLFVGVVGWFFVSRAQLRPLQRLRRQPLQRHRDRRRRGAVLLHRRRGGGHDRQAGEESRARTWAAPRCSAPALSAILYLLVTAAVMGLVPHHALVGNGAPFVTAFGTIFSHGAWAGKLIAAVAVVSGIGALNGWTLVTTEVSRAAAQDGLFPRRSPGPTARTRPGSAS